MGVEVGSAPELLSSARVGLLAEEKCCTDTFGPGLVHLGVAVLCKVNK